MIWVFGRKRRMSSDAANQSIEAAPAARRRRAVGIRVRGALLAAGCLALIGIAHWLWPREAGHGTHRQLGLPPCSFLSRTGYPCPTCGLTTSTAAMAHGRIGQAFLAHPLGVVLFAGVAAVAMAGLAELIRGRDYLRLLRPGLWWAVVVGAAMLCGWGFKIAYGLSVGTLPMR